MSSLKDLKLGQTLYEIFAEAPVLMWDGKTTHDQVEAQLHLGKCTQFLVTKKGEFFVVQYGNDAEMKADSQAAYKNLPRPFEANPILRSLKLVFREEEAA